MHRMSQKVSVGLASSEVLTLQWPIQGSDRIRTSRGSALKMSRSRCTRTYNTALGRDWVGSDGDHPRVGLSNSGTRKLITACGGCLTSDFSSVPGEHLARQNLVGCARKTDVGGWNAKKR